MLAMDADASGNLFAGNWDGTFFSVDTSTGQFTQIGSAGGMGFTESMDFAFDNNGTLWALDAGFNLYTIDPATGAGTYRTAISGLSTNAMGLMVDPSDNALYATTFEASSNLYRLDPNTGLAALVGSVGIPYPHGGDFAPGVTQTADFYQVTLSAGQTLTAATHVPASGPDEFVNHLDSLIFLYDAAGNPVAPDTSTKEGANARVSYASAIGGTYYVKVAGVNQSSGEYALSVSVSGGLVSAAAHLAGDGPLAQSASLTRIPAAFVAKAPQPALAPARGAILLWTSEASPMTLAPYSRASGKTAVDQAIAAVVVDELIRQGEPLHEALFWDRLLTSRRRSLFGGNGSR
jgi:hypothetical protein